MSVVRRNVMVTGDVQGVFFRDTCRRVASDAGVSGWATNLADGRVEVALEGEEGAVGRVIDWCRHGPRGATVDAVDITEAEPEGLSRFSIR